MDTDLRATALCIAKGVGLSFAETSIGFYRLHHTHVLRTTSGYRGGSGGKVFVLGPSLSMNRRDWCV